MSLEPEFPSGIVSWAIYLLGLATAVMAAGRKIGMVEANVAKDQGQLKSEVKGLKAQVAVILEKDLVVEDDIENFLTKAELEKEQSTCRRERGLEMTQIQERHDAKIALIAEGQKNIILTITEGTKANKAICDEIRILREALIRNGLEVKSKERITD